MAEFKLKEKEYLEVKLIGLFFFSLQSLDFLEVQQEWQKIQEQGSDLEKVERKLAELEFSIRDKESQIKNEHSESLHKIKNPKDDLVEMEEQLKLIEELLQEE